MRLLLRRLVVFATVTLCLACTAGARAAYADGRPFTDVDGSTPHAEDIAWLASAGISTGWDDGGGKVHFSGMSTVVRQDMAAFLKRLAVHLGDAGAEGYQPTDGDRARFTDVTDATPHVADIWWLAAKGISTGWDDGGGKAHFSGMSTVIRQDMAAFLHRESAYLEGNAVILPEVEPSSEVVWADGVKEVQGAPYSVDGAPGSGAATVTIAADSLPAGTAEGSVVVLGPTEGYPTGIALRAGACTVADGTAVVTGTIPKAQDVVKELKVSGTSTEATEFIPADDVTMVSKEDGSVLSVAPHDKGTIEFASFELKKRVSGESGSAEFSISFVPALDYTIDYSLIGGFKELYLAFKTDLDIYADAEWSSDKAMEQSVRLGALRMPTGIPAIGVNISVYLETNFDGEAEISYKMDTVTGLRYRNGDLNPVHKIDRDFNARMECTFGAGLNLTGSIEFLSMSLVDCNLGFGVDGEGSAEWEGDRACYTILLNPYMELGVGQGDSLAHDVGIEFSGYLIDPKDDDFQLKLSFCATVLPDGDTDPGDGSAENPYKVATVDDLYAVGNDPEAHYVQIADIDMAGKEWTPIGEDEEGLVFTGSYDGGGRKILNLSVTNDPDDPGRLYFGLFGYCDEHSAIKNVTLENLAISVDGRDAEQAIYPTLYVGGIAGKSDAGRVSNCSVTGVITVTTPNEKSLYVGGVTGMGDPDGSDNHASITVEAVGRTGVFECVACGGITGCQSGKGMVSQCRNYGAINAEGYGEVNCGGILGLGDDYFRYRNPLRQCINYGMVTASSLSASCCVGGIVGCAYDADVFDQCVNYGDVAASSPSGSGDYMRAGGIVGVLGGGSTLSNCYNLCTSVRSDGADYAESDDYAVGRVYAANKSTMKASNLYSLDTTLVNGAVPSEVGAGTRNGESMTRDEIDEAIAGILARF